MGILDDGAQLEGWSHPKGSSLSPAPPAGSQPPADSAQDQAHEPGGRSPKARLRRRRPLLIGTAERLALFHAAVVAVVLGIVVAQFVQAFARNYFTTIKRDLAEEVVEFSTAAANKPANQAFSGFVHDYLENHALPAGRNLIVGMPGHITLGTSGTRPMLASKDVGAWLAHPPRATVMKRMGVKGLGEVEVLATPIVASNQGHNVQMGTFIATASLARFDAERQRVFALAMGEAGITLVAGVASVYLLLRRLLGTVGRLTRTASDIAEGGDLHRRLGDQGRDEVGQMAATFDAMIEKVEGAMVAQRRLLSDVSHQLRTPLTVARGHLELLSRGDVLDPEEEAETVALVVEELDHMRSLVERLLLLGHALEPDFLDPQPIDLRSFILDIAEAARVLAERRWGVDSVPDMVITADPAKLRGAVLNLVDNAVKVTSPTDTIRLGASLVRPGPGAEAMLAITVEDSGPGIPPEQRRAVLGRFQRPGASDTRGAGLGLAIVAAVAHGHGGDVEIGESALGGARISILIPAGQAGGKAPGLAALETRTPTELPGPAGPGF